MCYFLPKEIVRKNLQSVLEKKGIMEEKDWKERIRMVFLKQFYYIFWNKNIFEKLECFQYIYLCFQIFLKNNFYL